MTLLSLLLLLQLHNNNIQVHVFGGVEIVGEEEEGGTGAAFLDTAAVTMYSVKV